MADLSSGVALVTGASSGIGEATARTLLNLGCTVYAGARQVDRMAELAALGSHTIALDVTDDAAMVAAVDRILQEQGRIDVLVNNAGYGAYGAMEDVSSAEARRQFDVNLFGLARLTQLVLPGMRARKRGRIVNIASVGGHIYGPMGSWYHATKFAVEGFSDALRLELAPFGIQVVIIEPGEIRTAWGGIAADSLRETSGSGAYAEQARTVAKVLERSLSSGTGSPPELVAETIGRAVTSRRPKTRYAVGRGARTLILARRLLPDRVFDRVMRRLFAG
ncbi:MAG: oxidoreductase [Chloroflexi bacterium]|nr:oxidoreductase [Chloroflexota bacterium]